MCPKYWSVTLALQHLTIVARSQLVGHITRIKSNQINTFKGYFICKYEKQKHLTKIRGGVFSMVQVTNSTLAGSEVVHHSESLL